MTMETGLPWSLARFLDRLGLVVLAGTGFALGLGYALTGVRPIDADIFWSAAHDPSYYGTTWGEAGSFFVYPPPIAQVLSVLPWTVFIVAWMTLLGLAWWAATRSWSLVTFGVSVGAVLLSGFDHPLANPAALTAIGNPQIVIAAAIVVGFRWPAAWAFVLLSKIAPGIGLLWFIVRREWRHLAIALGVTLAIAAISFGLAPGAWADFVGFATTNAASPSPEPVVPIPFPVRVVMASALIVWGARTERRWTVPIAAGWAALALYESSYITVWLGALGTLRYSGATRTRLQEWRHRLAGLASSRA
jgi:hypothetical protein